MTQGKCVIESVSSWTFKPAFTYTFKWSILCAFSFFSYCQNKLSWNSFILFLFQINAISCCKKLPAISNNSLGLTVKISPMWLVDWILMNPFESIFSQWVSMNQASASGSMVKNLPASAGDTRDAGLIPRSGRSPGGGNGNPLQYVFLEKSHWQRSLAGWSPWGHKE